MEQQANYIRRIEIHGLWERFNIGWDLRPDVNILSGINGVGKTTILNRSVGYLEELSGEMKSDEKNGVRLFFDNPQATYIPYDVIRSYDRPLIMGDFTARMADKNVKSELDWQLYLLQRRYLDYQVNIGNKMIEMLSSIDEEERRKAATLSVAKRRFQDMIDELFSYTRKKICLLYTSFPVPVHDAIRCRPESVVSLPHYPSHEMCIRDRQSPGNLYSL